MRLYNDYKRLETNIRSQGDCWQTCKADVECKAASLHYGLDPNWVPNSNEVNSLVIKCKKFYIFYFYIR